MLTLHNSWEEYLAFNSTQNKEIRSVHRFDFRDLTQMEKKLQKCKVNRKNSSVRTKKLMSYIKITCINIIRTHNPHLRASCRPLLKENKQNIWRGLSLFCHQSVHVPEQNQVTHTTTQWIQWVHTIYLDQKYSPTLQPLSPCTSDNDKLRLHVCDRNWGWFLIILFVPQYRLNHFKIRIYLTALDVFRLTMCLCLYF